MDLNQENNFISSGNGPSISSWAERNGFDDWVLALFWIVIAFILFQISAGIVAATLYFVREGIQAQPNPQEIIQAFQENLDLLFIGNSFGQIVFLGAATWLFSRLHTTKRDQPVFMRFQAFDKTPKMLALTAVLIVAAQPIIWFLSWINIQLPVPEYFESMQNTQLQLIEQFLRSDHNMMLTLFHIGLVPAVCEEILYRGYTLRAFEKSWGIWTAIIVSGFLFGLYHLQLTNLLPLAFIGIVLAYVTYVSESIYPAMLAHLINNGGSVLVASYYPDSSIAEMTPESMPPAWALTFGIVISAWIINYMYQHRQQTQGGTTDV
ncbi:lysostaphin resistance A-like protein [Halalkalibaculum sp. DA384]|uniref:CPBP family intramembrane glutamic endopeptidase n=1 Tax=Halalkalibaculum sp. DA384 TaxID=3373606 RepID=UPI003754E085